jgi:LacI family transcriptional regulator
VLVILNTGPGWSRGILRGFMTAAYERDWTPVHYHPPVNLDWLTRKFAPVAAVIGPELALESVAPLAPASVISVAVDRGSEGIASVCVDEEAIAALALEHLLATGLRHVTTARFDDSQFAIARERGFVEHARAAAIRVAVGWGSNEAGSTWRGEDPAAMAEWLLGLPRPCGIFTCTDGWARIVARCIRLAGLRVPEDFPLVGADNDIVECELLAPPLSSVMIPWQELGRNAATFVQLALAGKSIEGKRLVSAPIAVFARRSSNILAIDDALVAEAVSWIRRNADQRLTVPMVARAVGGGRQRLERRFRRVLDRTVVDEIRRVRVEVAKDLLQSTGADMPEIARRSGFRNAALLSVAFRRELGVPPSVYRRRLRQTLSTTHED